MVKLKIGSLVLSNQLILAPMFKITDLPFRILCREQGASLAFAEMTHCDAILRNPRIAAAVTHSNERDKPFGIQLAAENPGKLLEAIRLLEDQADLFDLNLGCPSPRTRATGHGSALLAFPQKISQLVAAMRKATDKPITAKIRLPPHPEHAVALSKLIADAGADALTVHARAVSARHSGDVDLGIVARIKSELSIPVINNGGVRNAETLGIIAAQTNCDGFMLARSAIGNPGIFAQVQQQVPISSQEALVRYLSYCEEFEFRAFGRIKMQCLHFVARQSPQIKNQFQKAKTFEELRTLSEQLEIPSPNPASHSA